MPADLMRAVNHAHVILSWQEHLPEEELPPEWMWSLDESLEKWFDEVKEARKERYGHPSDSRSDDTVVPMMQNDLTRNRRRR